MVNLHILTLMALIKREKNCENCAHCVTGANRRFRCTALPSNPGLWWDGYASEHWCSVYYSPKTKVTSPVEEKENILDKPVKSSK